MTNKTSLRIHVRDTAGNDRSTNVGYVNGNLTDAQLKNFAQTLNALSTNTFKAVFKIEETDITTATEGY